MFYLISHDINHLLSLRQNADLSMAFSQGDAVLFKDRDFMTKNAVFFYVPFPSSAVAMDVCKRLLDKRLIGCANIMPIQSVYRWEGNITTETEVVAVIKTVVALSSIVKEEIARLHPYAVPCIASASVSVNDAFVQWLESECSGEHAV